jgi:hypothetical protein
MDMNKGLKTQLPRLKVSHKRTSIFWQWEIWAAALLFSNVLFWSFQIVRYVGSRPDDAAYESGSTIVSAVVDGVISVPSVRVGSAGEYKLSPAVDALPQQELTVQGTPGTDPAPKDLSDDPQQLASELIWSWHTAWAKQDIRSYLEAYSSYYAPPGASREHWVRQRRQMIKNKKFINIKTHDLVARLKGPFLTATFRMDYMSDSYTSSSEKELTFQKEGGKWLIVKEVTKS